MRDAQQYLGGLARVHRHEDAGEALALWRQGVATLAAVAGQRVPAPLEALDPADLDASVTAALERGFVDGIDFLSPEAAAVALFELASALPAGDSKRELGRRILLDLQRGSAEVFVALATSLALTSPRGLGGDKVRAKVALALQLPSAAAPRVDALALALISRRELVRDWLTVPATGSLPQRRLAARLLERAAREASRRARAGDDSGVRVFRTGMVQTSWAQLLDERESLVWRHAARARGVLARHDDEVAAAIERELATTQSITRWRRAAAGLAAAISEDDERTVARCRQILDGPLLARDPGLAGAMVYGLPMVAESGSAIVDELLELLIPAGGIEAAEALVDLRAEHHDGEAFAAAAVRAATGIRDAQPTIDDGLLSLRESVARELHHPAGEPGSVRAAVFEGLQAFTGDSDEVLARVTGDALARLDRGIHTLEDARESRERDRRAAFAALRDIDASLLETSALRDLLVVAGRVDGLRHLDDVFDRLSGWLVGREREHVAAPGGLAHPTWRLRRLKTLLHLVDSDAGHDDDESMSRLRARRRNVARLLLARVRDDADSPLRRTVSAALSRALDAVHRDGLCELSDLILLTASYSGRVDDVGILAEATMIPELPPVYRCCARLLAEAGTIDDLRALANALPAASAPRVEALRTALFELASAMAAIRATSSLESLVGTEPSALERLAQGAARVAELLVGARRRLELPWIPPSIGAAFDVLLQVVTRAVSGGQADLKEAVDAVVMILHNELPTAIAGLVAEHVQQLTSVPVRSSIPDEPSATEEPLPPWLPASRILGGFYILRTIGAGAVGSVFVACRSDARHERDAETFALKVPEYSGAMASTLSEREFLRMFREEAGALLALPEHPNLARFVTFDAGVRPKPILVMEMVPGPNLEDLLDRKQMSVGDALAVLAGVARGLGAMHAVGVAHLDVKPANIILRHAGDRRELRLSGAAASEPVLVDFGLAGRHLRPGCASPYYGAPEIWLAEPIEPDAAPTAADVYAFACLAFELLTGGVLFTGDTPVDVITGHLEHDGLPAELKNLTGTRLEGLGEVLFGGLRRRPSERQTVAELSRGLDALAPRLRSLPWPLPR